MLNPKKTQTNTKNSLRNTIRAMPNKKRGSGALRIHNKPELGMPGVKGYEAVRRMTLT